MRLEKRGFNSRFPTLECAVSWFTVNIPVVISLSRKRHLTTTLDQKVTQIMFQEYGERRADAKYSKSVTC